MTLQVDRINKADGSLGVDTDYVISGSAKAAATISQSGTQAIQSSFNISSITDQGTGSTTFSFTSSFANSDYHALGTVGDKSSAFANSRGVNVGGHLVGSVQFNGTSASNAFLDQPTLSCAILGDLA